MDNNNASQRAVAATPGYQTLGKKVFWLFFLQMAPIAFILLLISIVLFISSFQTFLVNSLLGNMQKDVLLASLIFFVLSLFTLGIALAMSWITYINYTFLVGDDSFKIKRGFLSKVENAIPYRQMQNVDIERSFMFQMLGLSRLIILTAGHEDEKINPGDEAEGVIPAIDQGLATWLQTELLRRADIQKTIQISNQQNATTGKN